MIKFTTKSRVEKATFRTADDVPFEATLVFTYLITEKEDGKITKDLSVKAGLTGTVPIEGWDSRNDLSKNFMPKQQEELRDSVRRFVELREAHEILAYGEPRMLGMQLRLNDEEDVA